MGEDVAFIDARDMLARGEHRHDGFGAGGIGQGAQVHGLAEGTLQRQTARVDRINGDAASRRRAILT